MAVGINGLKILVVLHNHFFLHNKTHKTIIKRAGGEEAAIQEPSDLLLCVHLLSREKSTKVPSAYILWSSSSTLSFWLLLPTWKDLNFHRLDHHNLLWSEKDLHIIFYWKEKSPAYKKAVIVIRCLLHSIFLVPKSMEIGMNRERRISGHCHQDQDDLIDVFYSLCMRRIRSESKYVTGKRGRWE